MSGTVSLNNVGHIAHILIDDIPNYNAMTLQMWQEMTAAIDSINENANVRVAVIRGAGDRAFVSGANITEFEKVRSSSETTAIYNAAVKAAQSAISLCRVPVIASIQGICYGGGLGLALSCDLRYASAESKFRVPAARLGLGYGVEGVQSMLENIRPSVVAEALYRSKVYTADEALAAGMVNGILPQVHDAVNQIAEEIANNAPLTIRAAKLAIRAALNRDSDVTLANEAVAACFASEDYKEGRKAFSEKRPPVFKGL
jgi:enoyl-CoA hydratase